MGTDTKSFIACIISCVILGFSVGVLFEGFRTNRDHNEWVDVREARHTADLTAEYARGRYDQLYEIRAMSTTPEFTSCVAEKFKQLTNSGPSMDGSKE